MEKKNKPKIIITGGSGMVGSQVNFGIRLNHKQLDFLNKKSINSAIDKYEPNIIVHLGALVDMLACEKNPKLAHKINVTGTKNLAEICKKRNIKLVYMSTCAVFNGNKKTPYKEIEKTGSPNVYGQTKLEAELIIQKILKDYLIIRTGWLFGGGKNDKKFVRAIYLKMKAGDEIKAVNDRYGSPTFVSDLLNETYKLIKENKSGIYHIVNNGCVSYFEVAQYIKSIGKFKAKIVGIKSKSIENKNIKRGKMEALTSYKIKLRSWKKAVREYLL
jgi:dTDP-4-dehydrorhamnose reductase